MLINSPLGFCGLYWALQGFEVHYRRQQTHHHYRDNQLTEHIGAVVADGILPNGFPGRRVASPDNHAGQHMAYQADKYRRPAPEADGGNPVAGNGLCEQAGETQAGEGHHIVQQNHQEIVDKVGHRRRPEAHHHVDQGIDKGGEGPPLWSIAEGDNQQRDHAGRRDGAALGQGEDFYHGQHCSKCHHDGALGEHTGFGCRFRHFVSTSFLL